MPGKSGDPVLGHREPNFYAKVSLDKHHWYHFITLLIEKQKFQKLDNRSTAHPQVEESL